MGRFVAGEEAPEAAEGALLQFAALWPVLPHLKQTRSPAMVLPLALIPELLTGVPFRGNHLDHHIVRHLQHGARWNDPFPLGMNFDGDLMIGLFEGPAPRFPVSTFCQPETELDAVGPWSKQLGAT